MTGGEPHQAQGALIGTRTIFVLTTLAHIHAARGEWRQAVDNQVSALSTPKCRLK